MNLNQLTTAIKEIQQKEQIPFDENVLQLTIQGEIYTRTLINVVWDREFSCFSLIFE